MHRRVVLLGVMALLFLAVWLWDKADCTEWFDGQPWDDADWPPDDVESPPKHPAGLTVYDGGRTLIPPKVTPETIARIRGL